MSCSCLARVTRPSSAPSATLGTKLGLYFVRALLAGRRNLLSHRHDVAYLTGMTWRMLARDGLRRIFRLSDGQRARSAFFLGPSVHNAYDGEE
jgi:hypothetical protein